MTMRLKWINYDAWELDNEYFVRSFCEWKACLKKSSRQSIKEYEFWEKTNNLEVFCIIQKQPPEVHY